MKNMHKCPTFSDLYQFPTAGVGSSDDDMQEIELLAQLGGRRRMDCHTLLEQHQFVTLFLASNHELRVIGDRIVALFF